MPASDKVVPLHVRSRVGAPADLRDPVYQCRVARLISREWRQHMSDREYSILTFISDHTVMLGKETYRFTYKSFTEGTALSCGTGKSERPVRECVRELEARGMIKIDENKRDGLIIGLNLEWNAEAPTTPKRLQNAGGTEIPTPDRRISEGQTGGNPHPLKNRFLEQSEEQSFRAIGSAGTARSEEPTSSNGPKPAVLSQIRHRSRPTSSVDDIQRQLPLGDCIQITTAGAPDPQKTAVAAAKLKAQRELKNPGSLVKTWAAAWSEVYVEAGATAAEWTKVEMGMLNKSVIAKWKGSAAELHEFVDWSVREWAMLRVTDFGWMKRDPAPLTPTIRFFLHFAPRFVAAFNKREVDRAMSGLNPQERMRREMMIKQGASAEEADREVMKRKAVGMLRDEIEAGIEKGRQLAREGMAAKINAEKIQRETARRVQRAQAAEPSSKPSEPMRYLTPEELQETLQQVSNFKVEPFDESR